MPTRRKDAGEESGLSLYVIWGSKSHRRGEYKDDLENEELVKEYRFETEAERSAFQLAIEEAVGWNNAVYFNSFSEAEGFVHDEKAQYGGCQ